MLRAGAHCARDPAGTQLGGGQSPGGTIHRAAQAPATTACHGHARVASTQRRQRHGRTTQDSPSDRLPSEPPLSSWIWLDGVCLSEEFSTRFRVLQSCPSFIRGRYRHAQRIALELISTASLAGDVIAEERGWKLFGLLSKMLLHRSESKGSVGKRELEARCDAFARGEWHTLLAAAGRLAVTRHNRQSHNRANKYESAVAKIRMEECRKARQILTSKGLAPGSPETLAQLKASRPAEPTELLPPEVISFAPASPIAIRSDVFVQTLKSAPRGSASGPGGTTYEHLKVALDDEQTTELMVAASTRFARAELPATVAKAFMAARMTALKKNDGRPRGVATGTSFRRIVASCLARIVGKEVEDACLPFLYALSSRAGTECVGHLFRAACDLDATAIVLSIDGVGAFDNVKRGHAP